MKKDINTENNQIPRSNENSSEIIPLINHNQSHCIENFIPRTGDGWFNFSNVFNVSWFNPEGYILAYGIIPVGHVNYGICGGMAHAVRDYFEHQTPVPQCTQLDFNSQLGLYMKMRQVESVLCSGGLSNYFIKTLPCPIIADHEGCLTEWSKIKATIDQNHPSIIGIILCKSYNPIDAMQNHQVLAYSYKLDNQKVTIKIYDPCFPSLPDLWMEFPLDLNNSTEPFISSNDPMLNFGGRIVYTFFENPYSPQIPPMGEYNSD